MATTDGINIEVVDGVLAKFKVIVLFILYFILFTLKQVEQNTEY